MVSHASPARTGPDGSAEQKREARGVMRGRRRGASGPFRTLALAACLALLPAAALAQAFTVRSSEVEDIKRVYGTVEATVEVPARARISGTLEALSVDEGSFVQKGEVVAHVIDEKLSLQARALEAKIEAARSQVTKAQLDYQRAEELFKRGTVSKSNIDQLQTALTVAENTLKANEADRAVIEQQKAEGDVLAPTTGRVLEVPVTQGSVIMAGEVVAKVAADGFLLRIEVPERHARFMKVGDPVRLGADELGDDGNARAGEIVKIYPEITQGRVVADARVPGLGDFFVGERTQVLISVGTRQAIIIPLKYVTTRFGLDFVHLAREGSEPLDIVVQLGERHEIAGEMGREPGVEILTGLKAGDELVMP